MSIPQQLQHIAGRGSQEIIVVNLIKRFGRWTAPISPRSSNPCSARIKVPHYASSNRSNDHLRLPDAPHWMPPHFRHFRAHQAVVPTWLLGSQYRRNCEENDVESSQSDSLRM